MTIMFRLAICSGGVYGTFLVWAIAQERLSSTFDAPLVLQLIQSTLCALLSCLYLRRQTPTPSFSPQYLLVAVSITLSPVFAFASLHHISYPTMVLAKSCKLIPTMLINILLYRSKFKPYKYALVLAVTLGVFIFMYKSPSNSRPNSPLGLVYLLVNLLLDGLTNSTQDAIFANSPNLSGQQLMFSLSLLSSLISLFLLLILPVSPNSLNSLPSALSHLYAHPHLLPSLLQYGLSNALGQLFIFETLRHFGSLTLITLTLTRKLFTMLLSVLLYHHNLSTQQWLGTAIVFTAIAVEAAIKRSEILQKQSKKLV